MLISPVEANNARKAAVDSLGPVRHIVSPNKLHNLYLGDWKIAYPGALLHASPGLRARRPDIEFDADLSGDAHQDWAGDVDQVLLRNRIADEVVFFHRQSGTVLFTDILQNLPKDWFKGWRALVAWADLMTGDQPAVPRKFRLAFTDRLALRSALRVISSWPLEQVVMAHGTPVTRDAKGFLTRAFAWAQS